MWKGGEVVVTLAEILKSIPDNSWMWSILDFYAIGTGFQKQPMPEFERDVRQSPSGLSLSWREINSFASSLVQVHDCLIVATLAGEILDGSAIRAGCYDGTKIVIEAVDSSYWNISIDDKFARQTLGRLYKRI